MLCVQVEVGGASSDWWDRLRRILTRSSPATAALKEQNCTVCVAAASVFTRLHRQGAPVAKYSRTKQAPISTEQQLAAVNGSKSAHCGEQVTVVWPTRPLVVTQCSWRRAEGRDAQAGRAVWWLSDDPTWTKGEFHWQSMEFRPDSDEMEARVSVWHHFIPLK